MHPAILSCLEDKIHNIYQLGTEITPDTIAIALRKLSRLSVSEVVTLPAVGRELVESLPPEITANSRILDIASKTGEFAGVLLQKYGDGVTYECTRKIYRLLGLPAEHIYSGFTSYDIIDKTKNEKLLKELADMKFNAIVGNPPKDWNEKMLNDEHFSVIKYYSNSNDVFPAVEIKGGIALSIWRIFCPAATRNPASLYSVKIRLKFWGEKKQVENCIKREYYLPVILATVYNVNWWKEMKRFIFLSFTISVFLLLSSCASMPTTSRERQLHLSGYSLLETDFGGVERWYVVDKYNYDSLIDEVRFQVGYFKENNIGFILYGTETIGEEAYFSRDGLNLRWDWGSDGYGTSYKYSFVIEPDGTGLYYDFSASKDGTAKPRGFYKVRKF